jgi:hypothetical protein
MTTETTPIAVVDGGLDGTRINATVRLHAIGRVNTGDRIKIESFGTTMLGEVTRVTPTPSGTAKLNIKIDQVEGLKRLHNPSSGTPVYRAA